MMPLTPDDDTVRCALDAARKLSGSLHWPKDAASQAALAETDQRPPDAGDFMLAQFYATLAVAEELRGLREHLEGGAVEIIYGGSNAPGGVSL